MADQTDPDTAEFIIDLTAHEATRRAEVLQTLEDSWDPIAVMEGEELAYRLLYSNLDPRQQAIYDQLVACGVLPPRGIS